MNTEKSNRIRIRILFGLKKSTEYEYEYYLAWKNCPNTNTNTSIIYSNTELFAHLCQSWGSSWHHSWGPSYKCYSVWRKKLTEYKYEYYSVWKYWPNTNTNIIRFEKIDRIRIRILFGLKISTEYEYEYYSAWKNHPNTNTNTSIRPQLFE